MNLSQQLEVLLEVSRHLTEAHHGLSLLSLNEQLLTDLDDLYNRVNAYADALNHTLGDR